MTRDDIAQKLAEAFPGEYSTRTSSTGCSPNSAAYKVADVVVAALRSAAAARKVIDDENVSLGSRYHLSDTIGTDPLPGVGGRPCDAGPCDGQSGPVASVRDDGHPTRHAGSAGLSAAAPAVGAARAVCLLCSRPIGDHSLDTADICNTFIGEADAVIQRTMRDGKADAGGAGQNGVVSSDAAGQEDLRGATPSSQQVAAPAAGAEPVVSDEQVADVLGPYRVGDITYAEALAQIRALFTPPDHGGREAMANCGQANAADPSEDRTIGGVTWHSSGEDGGPDVGVSLYLGLGELLYAGEISDDLFARCGGAKYFDGAGGWFLVHFSETEAMTTLIGKLGERGVAQDFIDHIAVLARRAALSPPQPESEG